MWSSTLLLHGHGDDPDSLAAVAASLADALRIDVARPTAPHRVAGAGWSWWPDEADGPDHEDRAAVAALAVGPRPLVCGFSQGAAMALVSAPPHATVVSVAGFLPGDATVTKGHGPLLVAHGEDDETVDPLHATLVSRRGERAGRPVTTVVISGGHAWTGRTTEAVLGWLGALPLGPAVGDRRGPGT